MAERAVFISRTSAHFALIKQGRRNGLPDTMIALRGRTYPRYVKSQFIGWEAWVPPHVDATYSTPVYEE